MMDKAIQELVETIINSKPSNEKWRRCTLPVKLEGIGMRSLSGTMLRAFLSSVNSTLPIVSTMLPAFADIDFVAGYTETFGLWTDVCRRDSIPTSTIFQN